MKVKVPTNAQLPKRKAEKRGRKKIKRAFEATTLGHSLKLNAPLEYRLILDAGGSEPDADLIETISYASINPYFKGAIFRQLLIKYRQNGCYQRVPLPVPTLEEEQRYIKIRKKRISRLKI